MNWLFTLLFEHKESQEIIGTVEGYESLQSLGSSENITKALLCELCKESFSGVSVVPVEEREMMGLEEAFPQNSVWGGKSACCSSPDALEVGWA